MTHHTRTLRKELSEHWSFECINLYKKSKMFDGVTSSLMIFKFVKNAKIPKISVFDA